MVISLANSENIIGMLWRGEFKQEARSWIKSLKAFLLPEGIRTPLL